MLGAGRDIGDARHRKAFKEDVGRTAGDRPADRCGLCTCAGNGRRYEPARRPGAECHCCADQWRCHSRSSDNCGRRDRDNRTDNDSGGDAREQPDERVTMCDLMGEMRGTFAAWRKPLRPKLLRQRDDRFIGPHLFG